VNVARNRCSRATRANGPTVGKQLTGVVEENDAIAQERPALLGVVGDGVRGVPVRTVSGRAMR
jgi:uncharacterized protein (DUF342 family)